MTDDPRPAPGDGPGGTATAVPVAAPGPDTPLERYQVRLRRQRIMYASVVTAVVVVLAVVASVMWSRGETSNTTLHTASAAPAALSTAPAAPSLKQTWTTSSRAAIGQPQWQGTVVVADTHTVRGLDARTGATTWFYTRSDRRVCSAAQIGGVTVAVYALRGNCDQVTGLDSGTGRRQWTRTLDMDGMPVTGTPVFSTDSQTGFNTLLVRTDSVIYALDPSSGYNRWTYTRYGCTITGAVVGTAGGLVSQTCSNKVRCGTLKFCGTGPQLFLLPNGFNRDDAMKDTNPDHIVWNTRGVRAVPASADGLVSAVVGGRLEQVDAQTGKVAATTTLTGAAVSAPITASDAGTTELLQVGGRLYALEAGTPAPRWSLAVDGTATAAQSGAAATPTAAGTRVTVPIASGAATVDATTGRTLRRSALGTVPSGSAVLPLGSGFLVTSDRSTTAFA